MRALRRLAPIRAVNWRRVKLNERLRTAVFTVGLAAFAVSVVPLGVAGLGLHLAPCLLGVAVVIVLLFTRPAASGLCRLFHDKPDLALANLVFVVCVCYATVNAGASDATTHIESYLSAGLLAIALENGTDPQKRNLARCIVGYCTLSLMTSIGEGLFRIAFAAPLIGDANIRDLTSAADYLPGAGLFGDLSTARLVTSMAAFLLLRMPVAGLLKAALLSGFLVAALGLGAGLIILPGAALLKLAHGLIMRTLSLTMAAGAAIMVIACLTFALLTDNDAGGYSLTHITLDAGVFPSGTWPVLNHLNLRDVLFGVPPDRLAVLLLQINLGQNLVVIDNMWLRMFLDLGVICSFVLLCGFGLFLLHLGRMAGHPLGWLLLTTVALELAGESGSPGDVDLLALAACLIAMSGYTRSAVSASLPREASNRLPRLSHPRMLERASGGRLTHASLAGHQP